MPRMILAAALAAAAFAPAVMAGTAQVHLNDLDLSTEAGRTELNARIDKAAAAVCTTQVRTGTILNERVNRSCVTETRARIEQQVAARISTGSLGG